jgi:glycosyltransferase involved in cell wall biosynthesis
MSVSSPKKVCLVIPAYNEERVIGDVVRELDEAFKKSGFNYKIVVVSDGSRDNTALVAEKSGAHVINHILNTGSGGATATGLSYAYQKGFDIATTSDADGQHDPADVLHAVELLSQSETDLLIGSRLIDTRGMSRVKVLGNTGLSTITNILFGVRVTDSQSGLRAFSAKALSQLKWKTSGYEFCSEMLWRAKQAHLTIDEFPIKAIYTDYSQTKGQNNWNAINIIKSLAKQRIAEIFE